MNPFRNNPPKICIKGPGEKTNCKEQATQRLAVFSNVDEASNTTHISKRVCIYYREGTSNTLYKFRKVLEESKWTYVNLPFR